MIPPRRKAMLVYCMNWGSACHQQPIHVRRPQLEADAIWQLLFGFKCRCSDQLFKSLRTPRLAPVQHAHCTSMLIQG
jgi:hypothetical protein